jgi:hypothetical protein
LEISFLRTVPFLLKAVCLPWSPYLVGLRWGNYITQ